VQTAAATTGPAPAIQRRWWSGLEVEVAAFETWDPAGRVFDAVIAGQAWHWVDQR
jgi:hypothetical protein